MATVRDLIRRSFTLIGVLADGETASASDQADAFQTLNDMLSSFSNENLVIYSRTREEFSLVPGQSSYTLGPSGNFNTTRPVEIQSAAVELQGAHPFEQPVAILNSLAWAGIGDKSAEGSVPTSLYSMGTYPLETLNVWPVPTAAEKLVLYSLKPLTAFASVNDTVDLPPGYFKLLRYGLALELAPEYGKTVDAAIAIQFSETKENIKVRNVKVNNLSADLGTLPSGRFNIVTGD